MRKETRKIMHARKIMHLDALGPPRHRQIARQRAACCTGGSKVDRSGFPEEAPGQGPLRAMWVFYSVSMGLVLGIVISMISRYAAPKVSILTLGVTTVAWLMSLSVLALVPLDVWAALSGGASARDEQVLGVLWTVSYWSTQGLTWAAIPVLQYYSLSGAFTIFGRLRHALFRLWVFYAVVLALCVAGVLVALGSGRLRLRTLPTLLITLSNTYGLICIIVAL
ncbi:hypothetical protein H632_c3238p0, partial [Helicosporidium sp. ATCC 50920]